MKKHIKSVDNKIKDHLCLRCDAKLSSSGGLKLHIKSVHNKIKDMCCSQCEAKFSERCTLKRHITHILKVYMKGHKNERKCH